MAIDRPWATPELTGAGRVPMRPPLDPYDDLAAASAGLPSPWVQSLDGTWEFVLADSPDLAMAAAGPDAPAAEWERIEVPGSWVLQGGPDHRWGAPAYTNVVMPFDQDPPEVPAHNPTGLYRRSFRVPKDWRRRRVLL